MGKIYKIEEIKENFYNETDFTIINQENADEEFIENMRTTSFTVFTYETNQ